MFAPGIRPRRCVYPDISPDCTHPEHGGVAEQKTIVTGSAAPPRPGPGLQAVASPKEKKENNDKTQPATFVRHAMVEPMEEQTSADDEQRTAWDWEMVAAGKNNDFSVRHFAAEWSNKRLRYCSSAGLNTGARPLHRLHSEPALQFHGSDVLIPNFLPFLHPLIVFRWRLKRPVRVPAKL